ncbi:hypothetical protein CIB93_10480 [Streptomyces sp. WZ.A104]|nr:hypothetical protein CIB93_10480 [Streptomyces sp. WZ.A104]
MEIGSPLGAGLGRGGLTAKEAGCGIGSPTTKPMGIGSPTGVALGRESWSRSLIWSGWRGLR